MNPVRILFTSTPLDGHVRPMLPLARALRERGHAVAFATEPDWHPHVEAEGFDALAAGRSHQAAWQHVEPEDQGPVEVRTFAARTAAVGSRRVGP